MPYPGSTTVSSINGGVEGMTVTLALELAPIRVNALHPGIIGDSPFWAGKPAEVFPAPALAEMKQVLLPIEREWMDKAKKKGMADPQKVLDQLRADIAAAR